MTIALPVIVLLYWLPYRARARTLAGEGRPVPGWRQGCYVAGLIVLGRQGGAGFTGGAGGSGTGGTAA